MMLNSFNGTVRSPTVVMSYLMSENLHTAEEAREFVVSKRAQVSPFISLLNSYDKFLNLERLKKIEEDNIKK